MRSNSVIWDFFLEDVGSVRDREQCPEPGCRAEVIDLGFQECWDHQSDGTVTGQTKLAHWSPPQCHDHWSVTLNTQELHWCHCWGVISSIVYP